MVKLDQKDKQIVDVLQKNSRMPLTEIAKEIELSIDSTHKRIKKMLSAHVFKAGVFINPKAIGHPFIIDVRGKLRNTTKENVDKFFAFLRQHPHVATVVATIGDWDFTLVLVAKDADQMNAVMMEIREKFANLIADWDSAMTLKVYKLEEYDVLRL